MKIPSVRHRSDPQSLRFFETRRPHHDVKEALIAKGIDVGRTFAPFGDWVRFSIGLPAENALAPAAAGGSGEEILISRSCFVTIVVDGNWCRSAGAELQGRALPLERF